MLLGEGLYLVAKSLDFFFLFLKMKRKIATTAIITPATDPAAIAPMSALLTDEPLEDAADEEALVCWVGLVDKDEFCGAVGGGEWEGKGEGGVF